MLVVFLIVAALCTAAGCINIQHSGQASVTTPKPGVPEWTVADLKSRQEGLAGGFTCFYKVPGGSTYGIGDIPSKLKLKDCPTQVEIDINSYVFHADPIFMGESFKYRPLQPAHP